MALRASTDFELVEAVPGQQLVGVPAELHIYAGTGHGFGLRANEPKPAGKWIERFAEWLADSGFLKKPQTTNVNVINSTPQSFAHLKMMAMNPARM